MSVAAWTREAAGQCRRCLASVSTLCEHVRTLSSDVDKLRAAHSAELAGCECDALPDFRAALVAAVALQSAASYEAALGAVETALRDELLAAERAYRTAGGLADATACDRHLPYPGAELLLSQLDAAVLTLRQLHTLLAGGLRELAALLAVAGGDDGGDAFDKADRAAVRCCYIATRGHRQVSRVLDRLDALLADVASS